eukprot:1536766-Amphidinium_carterae.1
MPDITALSPALVRTDMVVNYASTEDAWSGLEPIADNFAARWSGGLVIIKAGTYTLKTSSDDGSWLFMDGELVVDNGGWHAMLARSSTIELRAGVHQVTLEMFENRGDA